jgi:hypothetical protein
VEFMKMAHSRYTIEEIGRRGEELYQQQIRAKVESQNRGKYLVLDIDTGEYEIGDDVMSLWQQMHSRHQDAALYTVKVGFPVTARIGKARP